MQSIRFDNYVSSHYNPITYCLLKEGELIARTNSYSNYRKKNWLDHYITNNKLCSKIHPIIVTLIQLPLLAMVIWLFNSGWIISSLLILGAIIWPLDLLDGKFARIFNKETQLGAFLDPVVDKIRFLVPMTFFFNEIIWIPLIIMFWMVEISLVLTRVVKLISSKKKRKKAHINAFSVGKIKAWGEMIGLLLVFFFFITELNIFLWLGYIILIPSLVLACWSLYSHVYK